MDSTESARLQYEFKLAAAVQQSMLPETLPIAEGYSFWAFWRPASAIGGDMYAFQTLEHGEILILAADVAGKGTPAALGMASLSGMIRPVLEQTGTDLVRFVASLNKHLFQWVSRVDRFVALLAIALNPVAHRLRIVNACYDHALIRRQDGTLENLCLVEGNLPLGVVEECPFTVSSKYLEVGDAVVIASDGVTNALNANGDEYGAWRLKRVLERSAPPPRKLGEAVLEDLNSFTGATRAADDITLICFGRDQPSL
jgi:sigma-B regulation protein RsbU (phosphoserine phosphatase)